MKNLRALLPSLVVSLAILMGSCSSIHQTGDDSLGPSTPAPPTGALRIPPRSPNAPSGSAFIRMIRDASPAVRERLIQRQLLAGNIPSFLRRLVPIHLSRANHGRQDDVIAWVMPDYLAIGSDTDYIRIPVTPRTAQRVAERFGCVLPTPRLVRQIALRSSVRLEPQPLRPGREMTGLRYIVIHNDLIERQLRDKIAPVTEGSLVSGHKKDIVATAELSDHPNRVAIFGWVDPRGHNHQPLSLAHGANYADYSHGARLVLNVMRVNGANRRVSTVLKDPMLSPLVSHEGILLSASATGPTP